MPWMHPCRTSNSPSSVVATEVIDVDRLASLSASACSLTVRRSVLAFQTTVFCFELPHLFPILPFHLPLLAARCVPGSQSCFDLLRSLLLHDLSQSVSGVLWYWHVCRCFLTRYFCYKCCPYCGSLVSKFEAYSDCECYDRYASVWNSADSSCGYNSGCD